MLLHSLPSDWNVHGINYLTIFQARIVLILVAGFQTNANAKTGKDSLELNCVSTPASVRPQSCGQNCFSHPAVGAEENCFS